MEITMSYTVLGSNISYSTCIGGGTVLGESTRAKDYITNNLSPTRYPGSCSSFNYLDFEAEMSELGAENFILMC
jgi:hypothetical protein